jgi:hypothetical protein
MRFPSRVKSGTEELCRSFPDVVDFHLPLAPFPCHFLVMPSSMFHSRIYIFLAVIMQ